MTTSIVVMEGATSATARPVLVTDDPRIVAEVKAILIERIGRGVTPLRQEKVVLRKPSGDANLN